VAAKPPPAAPAPATAAAKPAPAARPPRLAPPEAEAPPTAARAVGPLSPAVRRLLAEHDLDPTLVPASGKGGRLTKEDVLAYLERSARPVRIEVPAAPTPSAPLTEGEERVPMSPIRRRIAERLVQAQRTAAILTTFNEIDMSEVIALRAEHKERFQKQHGIGLGFMSFFARACIAALRDIPVVNAEIRGDDIIYRKFVHLGVAVGTERGLVVPVLHHAERMSFADIEREIARLAGLARDGKLKLDDLAGGTFTISNGGVYGSLLSTPILNPPQSAILGMHKIEKRPVVADDQIVIRPMMYVALSYDHRLVDGEQAVTFLVRVKERLEDPERLLLDV
jgi:2-oxoglutarate dehydrogenase E2 component (dihydrolipoamide succinyltransferase)